MLKRVAILLFCLMMIFIATFGFVVGVVSVPTIYSYAAVNDDSIYVPLRDPSDLVLGFQAYCKSRDLTIEGSLTDAVTTFTTGAFNSACNEIGINISQLQAEIKAEYDQSGKPVKFLFNDTGVMAMNRIFAQFLQDNELEVGDSDIDKTVYDGYYSPSTNSLIYVLPTKYQGDNLSGVPLQFGSVFGVDGQTLYKSMSLGETYTDTLTIRNQTINLTCDISRNTNQKRDVLYARSNGKNGNIYTEKYENNETLLLGNTCIFYSVDDGKFYFGYVSDKFYTSQSRFWIWNWFVELNSDNQSEITNNNVLINITSNQINNNTYEGDTIINNDGDVIVEPDPVPPGGNDPGWDIGGGGGTATDGDGNTWNIQFPDFQLPDLDIDWSINGLGEKFPFSIPFDLVALVTVLNAEPQAPRFEGTVNFGFTTWNYDINLQQFDSVAQACRIAELLLLVVGLILVTRSIIKG